MNIWFKRILYSLLLLLVLAVAINFQYFYTNVKYAFLRRAGALDERFQKVVAGEKETMEPNYLLIPSLGIQAPIIYISENSDQAFSKALQNGVVHYPGAALPGELGNSYIFGHSSDYPWKAGNHKTVFALLSRIKIGAVVQISDATGEVFTYTVTTAFVAGAGEIQYLNPDAGQKRILTLQTSWPLGTALKRWIVIAELTSP